MPAHGKYPIKTFVDGSYAVPVDEDNLNDISDALDLADTELARSQAVSFKKYKNYFYNRNIKEIDNFQDNTDWTAAASTTLSDDSTNKFIGNNAVKVEESDNVASYVAAYQTISSVDLTKFNDGTTSTTDDIISLTAYISDYTKFIILTIKLGDDNSNNFSVLYDPAAQLTRNGWHTFTPKKSDFQTNGTPTGWDDITYVRIELYAIVNSIGEYVTPQLLSLVREDPDNPGYANPYQKYAGSITGWENKFIVSIDPWLLFKDPILNDIGMYYADQYSFSLNEKTLHIYCSIINFIFEGEFYSKQANEGNSITWYIDTNNYIELYIDSGNFKMDIVEGGASTTVSSGSFSIPYNGRYNVFFEKDFDTIRGILRLDGQNDIILEYETTISSIAEGCLYLGHYAALGQGFIANFNITNTEVANLDSWDIPKFIKKSGDEVIQSDDNLSNDADLFVNLPPNSIFEVELNVAVDGSDSAQDIKINWSLTNAIQFSSKNCVGPGTSATSISQCDAVYIQNKGITSETNYGVVSSGWSYIKEVGIVKTGILGGLINIQMAQNTSSATSITVKEYSWLKVTKIKA